MKFLTFNDQGNKIKRFQYTAIDDATRIRVIKIYPKHNQDHAIKFIDHVIHKMPFRINMVRTDNGHEFQARFHWHVMDQGIDHVYIKPGTPRLNGKVERSHRTDKEEFYQLIEFTDDVDLRNDTKNKLSMRLTIVPSLSEMADSTISFFPRRSRISSTKS